jgi:hypothetical protein
MANEMIKIPKLPDLSKIDLKDIDVNKIKDQLLENKEMVIQVALGVVTFFMIVSMWSGSQKEIKKYNVQINSMQSKSSIIEQYKKSQSDIDSFLKNLPPSLAEGQIINLVTDLADKNKVKILTFSPNAHSEGKKYYQDTSIQFSLQSADYKGLVRLIADIEHVKSILQIKSCSIQEVIQSDDQQQEGEKREERYLNFRVEVASLEVKE